MQQALGALGFDLPVAIANLVNFAIIFFLLNRYLFPQIRNAISERKQVIQEGIDNATKARTALMQANSESEHVVSDAKQQAFRIVANAQEKAEHVRAEIMEKASQEASVLRSDTIQALEDEQRSYRDKFSREAVNAVMVATERVIQRELDTPEKHYEFVTRLLKK